MSPASERTARRAEELQRYLLYFFTAALDGLVGVDTSGDGGELLLFLTQAHLRVHAVDEALHYCHLVEVQSKRHSSERNPRTRVPAASE